MTIKAELRQWRRSSQQEDGKEYVGGHVYNDPIGDPDGKHVTMLGVITDCGTFYLFKTTMFAYRMEKNEEYKSGLA